MNALWTANEAAEATGGKTQGDWQVNGVSIDTRTLEAGDLFVALTGENRDGHEFVPAALEKGAGAAMISKIVEKLDGDAPLLVVDDTQVGLEALGRAARARSKARIVAVTGSAGKTTTKEMLRLVLKDQGKVAASAASYNNHWGVPLSLTRMDRGSDFGVFEIGMNHEGEIRALVAQVRPHVGIITTIAPAHLEYFGTLEAIADAKAEIFEGIEPGGTAILPFDNPQFARLKARAEACGVANVLTFGKREGADARIVSACAAGEKQVVTADIRGARIEFALGAHGEHNAGNALAVLLAAQASGIALAEAAKSLGGFSALKGRGARVALGDIELIDESYNANPASMSAALGLLKTAMPKRKGRRIAVLGDMLELGPEGADLHRAIAKDLAANNVDLGFVCGPQMRALWDALPARQRGAYAENSSALKEKILAQIQPDDVVLVKGSFGSRMALIVDALKERAAETA